MTDMFHHDKRDYETARATAIESAEDKFGTRIEQGLERTVKLIEHLQESVPVDRLAVHGRDIHFKLSSDKPRMKLASSRAIQDPELLNADDPRAKGMDGADDVGRILKLVELPNHKTDGRLSSVQEEDGSSRLLMDISGHTVELHSNAISQIAERTSPSGAKLPVKYLKSLMSSNDPNLQRLCVDALNTHYKRTALSKKKSLVRSVNGEARGFLGSTYKRIDSMMLMQTLIEQANECGAVVIDARVTDVRCQVKLVLRRIYRPVDDSPMLLGIAWSTSDYGCGANCLSLFVERMWCTNQATTQDSLREVHTGPELHGDIAWSEDTRRKVTEASAATMRDYIKHMLSDESIGNLTDAIRKAYETEVSWKTFGPTVKRLLSKEEYNSAESHFDSTNQAVLLPPARTLWRASNVLSLIAQNAKTPDRALELERLAGRVFETSRQKVKVS